MKLHSIYLLAAVILSAAVFMVFQNRKQEKIHIHAGFKVFVDNQIQDFSGLKFMKLTNCGAEENGQDVDEQLEKAHLHDKIGNIVHIHRKGVKWGDLFKNLNFRFDGQKPLTGYINGKKADVILDQPIRAFDSVIIISGKVNNLENKIKNMVPRKKIEQIEENSESC